MGGSTSIRGLWLASARCDPLFYAQPLIMLPTILNRLFPRRSAPLLQLQRFRGSATGWQAIGAPRSAASAERLSATLARVAPEATLRTIPLTV